eukprot:TRINITY_DN17990_c2_g1_i1.p1 TRINITY_DN17990_c2_g1~~TRINITY_DN17990_c2_g1_i1.p1  ORF type:complete len:944 (+),score=189.89 TRINITY_DN17990_c2_g1_i1:195-2834(+)
MKRRYGGRYRGKRRKFVKENEPDMELDCDLGDCTSFDSEDYVPSSDLDSDDGESGYEKRLKKMIAEGKEKEEGEAVLEVSEDGEQDEMPAASGFANVKLGDLKKSIGLVGRRKKKRSRKRKDGEPPLLWEVWEEENERWIDDHGTDVIDMEANGESVAEVAEQPPDIIMALLRFQKEWLAWALKQEESESRGGILADEMGMGKTIQAISLVLAARFRDSDSNRSLPSSSNALPKTKCTLVICPVVALIQWKDEIARFTKEGCFRVLVHHGAKRSNCSKEFNKYDFVLTTYSIVEADYRKNTLTPKERCEWCGKLFYPKKMKTHLKYFCGPDAEKTEKQSKQVKKEKQPKKVASLKKSHHTVEKDGKTKKKGRPPKKASNSESTGTGEGEGPSSTNKSILHSVKWNRIILDEAHYIKDRRCSTAKAVLSLESSYKWALSGTPLQNRVGELYSLIRFLQISPYSYYFCKDCDCKCLDYSSTVDCPSCVHSASRHFCWWNKYIATPIQNRASHAEGRRAMILLRQKLLKGIVLRRTKKGRAADLALPPRIVTLRRDTFDSKEEDYYNALYTQSQAQFNTYIAANTLMNNYAHIFDLLTRLRQAVDHPYLVVYSRNESLSDGHKSDSVEDCGICHDPAEDAVVTSCEHVFCKACLDDYSAALEMVTCPSCSKPLTVDFTTVKNAADQSTTIKGFKRSSILNRINLDDFQTSTKIEALREEIRFMIERDGSAKAIVFSQFTSFLDLIKYSLQKSGLQCVQLVGSMSVGARGDAIKKFTDDPDCKIFLMSLKAGGVALNLTVASYVFLMDPWWNPAVERQAQDRIHRIGQHRPIRITRFIIENTVEERILRLQEKKELVFEGTVGGSSDALGKLTEADLRFLFSN